MKGATLQRIFCNGLFAHQPMRVIPIAAAPMMRCRWCEKVTEYREHWRRWNDKTIRCNRPDCRRMDYLEHVPKSKGGIELTPRQRQELPRDAWRTQRTINYLALVAKEAKNGRKPNRNVR